MNASPPPQDPWAQVPPGSLTAWKLAFRLHTLSAAAVPVLVAGALSLWLAPPAEGLFWLVLLGTLLVQIGANLTDEYADHDATGSAHKFPAPHKVIVRGLLTPAQVKRGAVVSFGLATLVGGYLVWLSGWPLLVLCLVAVFAAWAYSAGPFPLGDYALGEVLVFVMMGPVIVLGALQVLTQSWPMVGLWFSLPVGALVTNILVLNKLRDETEDRQNQRRTLVTLLGNRPMRLGYWLLQIVAYGAIPLLHLLPLAHPYRMGVDLGGWQWLPWLSLPMAVRLAWGVWRAQKGPEWHQLLRATSGLHMLYGLLLTLAIILAKVL